ncbi:DEAD/DEAH box helicase [Bacillus cereus group sp. BfR-BA-01408]|uniref:DEAD/DEAH box helicase n=1 Tax=Bacillus cereus group sp. BfR-BA-01408 TaxID=2920337 RepID=UPI001F57B131|nr:DEAD/DEAH box helicase [Bacillus cereus group sp. BfR-BA-01408]
MNTILLEEVISSKIKLASVDSEKKDLVVFIGFEPEQVSKLSAYKFLDYPFPTDLNRLQKSSEILQLILTKSQLRVPFLWVTMEEYQFCFKGQIETFFNTHFIFNNFYDRIFPIFYSFEDSQQLLLDFEDEDENIKSENFEYVSGFYNSLKLIHSKLFAAYTTDLDAIEWIPYYNIDTNLEMHDLGLNNYDITYSLSEDDTDFIQFTLNILNNQNIKHVEIVHSTNFDAFNNNYLQRLAIIQLLRENLLFSFTKHALTKKSVNEREYIPYLDKYFGYSSFNSLEMYCDPETSKETINIQQSQIINDILEQVENARNTGSLRDIFVTSSTGAGKSLMFQLPALILHEKHKYLTIVISPLIGLMNDQVEGLKESGVKHVATINSNITPAEKIDIQRRIANQEIAILYISPETLINRSDIRYLIGDKTKVGLFVIDEAHIVTTWGKAFRSDYWYLGTYLQKLRKEMPFPIATFTATAIYGGEEDMYKETRDSLGLVDPIIYLGKVRRDDIDIHLQAAEKKMTLNEYRKIKFDLMTKRIKKLVSQNEKVLVYFPTVPLIDTFMSYLESSHPMLYKKTTKYHGKLEKEEKHLNSNNFQSGENQVMFATKAFGMGINIKDINNVYHFAPTGNVCDYIQEIGRAARSTNIEGDAYFDYLEHDFSYINSLHSMSTLRKSHLLMVIEKILAIYKEKKSRNLLVNVEDFAYIFNSSNKIEDSDIDGKLKTALLLIEKDFTNIVKYSPFVARPRGIFSREYYRVDSEGQKKLTLKKYEQFATLIVNKSSSNMMPIYEFDLKYIWENKYKNISFPEFKWRFNNSDESLNLPFLQHIHPVMILRYTLNKSLESTLHTIFNTLEKLSEFFGNQALTGTFFKQEDLGDFISRRFKIDKELADSKAQVFLQAMSRTNNFTGNSNVKNVISESDLRGYKVGPNYTDFFNQIKMLITQFIKSDYCISTEEGTYEMFVGKNQPDIIEKITVVFGILEAFIGLNYQTRGGSSPEIYIRINSTLMLESISKNPNKYKNHILQGIYDKHAISNEMLKYIFRKQFETQEFWDLIEDYFLGRIPPKVQESIKAKRKKKAKS